MQLDLIFRLGHAMIAEYKQMSSKKGYSHFLKVSVDFVVFSAAIKCSDSTRVFIWSI